MQVTKQTNNPHHIVFDGGPTTLEEGAYETVRPRGLVGRHRVYGIFDLLLSDGVINARQVHVLRMKVILVKVLGPGLTSANDTLKMGVDDVLF